MRKIIFLLFGTFLFSFNQNTYAQLPDSTKKSITISGDISVTNNGISIVPAFALGKPALITNLAIGGKKLSFEPSWFFSMEAKPWAGLLWLRYKLADKPKFKTRIGVHLGMPYSEIDALKDGKPYKTIQVQRFLAFELAPNYIVNKHLSLGMYLLNGNALQKESLQRSIYIAFTPSYGNIKLGEQLLLRYSPQLYYLNLDGSQGVYVFNTLILSSNKKPFALSFNMNKKLKTDILVGKDLDWNVTLTYAFNREFVKK